MKDKKRNYSTFRKLANEKDLSDVSSAIRDSKSTTKEGNPAINSSSS